ncbi:MAG: 50S ribosomal protein L29 [Bacteroidetes bacterium]|jgi:large subunit ribosomal protein L29|nr:50S ribosomal protein L29 [Bacteroidota bacterium]
MPNKFMQDLKDLSVEDIKEKLRASEKEYVQLKFDHASKGLDSPIRIREIRRDIARMKTALRDRDLRDATEAELAKRERIRNRRRKS